MKKLLCVVCAPLCSASVYTHDYVSLLSAPGPYEVNVINYEAAPFSNHVYTKPLKQRFTENGLHNKKIFKNALTVFYPETDTKSPLIIISHGWGDSKKSQMSLAQYLASHGYVAATFSGYVCLYPEHFLAAIKEAHALLQQAEQDSQSHLCNKMDLQHTAVIGHSMGGTAALHYALKNTTIKAVIALNPYNGSSKLIELVGGTNAALGSDIASLKSPTLIITGTHDNLAHPEKTFAFCKHWNHSTPLAFFAIKGGKHAHGIDRIGIDYTGTFDAQKHSLYRAIIFSWLEWYIRHNTLPASYLFLNRHNLEQLKPFLHSSDESQYPPLLLQNLYPN
ncbi:MAG: alpha/beta hydrolase family protein [Treponema sp.]